MKISMIVNYFKFIDGKNVTRYACVVDGQPFYRSSGTSSGLEGTWLPLKKFGAGDPASGLVHKPDVAYNIRNEAISDYFPVSVANALQQWHDENPGENNWGRFGDMKCLLVSCMLSNESTIPATIRRAVIDYVGEHNYKNSYLWARPTVFDCGYMLEARQLNEDTIEECNAKLIQLGAIIPTEQEIDLDTLDMNTQPESAASQYPDIHDPTGPLQQFIDKIPSLITRAMRFFRQLFWGETVTPQPNNAVTNPLQQSSDDHEPPSCK
jgi:hypothetical protein